MKNFFKKIYKKIDVFWWLHVGYPIYMRQLRKKANKDLIDILFIDDIN